MTLIEVLKILHQHDKWKKDENTSKKAKMISPVVLGLTVDFMLTMEKHCDNRCDMDGLDDDINIEINYKSDYEIHGKQKSDSKRNITDNDEREK